MQANAKSPKLPTSSATPSSENIERSGVDGYLPNSLKGRGIDFVKEIDGLITSTTEVADGQTVTQSVTISGNSTNLLIGSFEWLVQVDSATSASNILIPYMPSLSSLDMADFIVYGPYNSLLQDFDGSSLPSVTDNQQSNRISIKNISGATVTLYFTTKIKYIFNSGGSTTT